jgi:integrase/recombinase XerD
VESALVPTDSTVPAIPEPLAPLVAGWLLGYSSEHTRSAYRRDFGDWMGFCADHGVDPLQSRRPHVDAWARSLEDQGRSAATVARKLAVVSSWYSWLVDEEILVANPAARVRRPRVGSESPRLGLDRDELRDFLDAARDAGPRDHALALLLAVNGLRISEVLALDTSDLDVVRGHSTVTIAGKGGRRDLVPLPPVVCDAVRGLLDGRTGGPLLFADDGSPLDRFDATRIVRRLAKRAGINKRISPHSLRHSAITAALDAGVPLRDVQDFARHADPRTTRRYDQGRHSLDRHASYAVAAFVANE